MYQQLDSTTELIGNRYTVPRHRRTFMPLAVGLFGVAVSLCAAKSGWAAPPKQKTPLDVAIFAYLPDAAMAIERLEEAFEAKHHTIDLDLELWNPYEQKREDDGLEQLRDFDIVEVDVCRLDAVLSGALGGLDELPAQWRGKPDQFVSSARTLLQSDVAARHVVPHWVCGNFLTFWSSNRELAEARGFTDVLRALDPGAERPLLTSMGGRTGLGELYADALIDLHGHTKAREHLVTLATDSAAAVPLDEGARTAVINLAGELEPANRSNLKHFNDHTYVFPRRFAALPGAALLGYSERLYFTERELQLTPGKSPPVLQPDAIEVRPFPFGEDSRGTPSWVDAFVVPKGKLARKRAAIGAFLAFIQTPEAFLAFAEPTPYLAASNLLPAQLSAYDDPVLKQKQPNLTKYRDALDGSFVVDAEKLLFGIQQAGKRLRNELTQEQ